MLTMVSLFAIAAACGDGGAPDVPFESLEHGDFSNLSAAGGGNLEQVTLFSFVNEGAFDEFWAKLVAGQERPPPPPVDFTTNTVVAVVDVMEPSTGYQVRVVRLREADDHITVRVEKRSPDLACGVGATITQPFFVIRVPRRNAVFRLSVTAGTVTCN